MITRRVWLQVAVYLLALTAIIGGRGWGLARAMGGQYRVTSLLLDALAGGLVILTLRLADAGLKAAVRRLLGQASRTRRVVGQAVHAVILVGLGLPFLLIAFQMHPQRIRPVVTPKDVGLAYTPVTLAADGLRLAAWHIAAAAPDRPVVLIAHGFNANKANFLVPAVLVHQLGYDAFMFDFRAHGDSDGFLSTFGFAEARDVKAAHDWIRGRYPARPVYALGYSMGGAAVIRAAAEYGIFDAIVLDSTFGSLEAVARATLLRPFGPLAGWLWHGGRFWAWVGTGLDLDQHRPARHVAALTDRPLLLVHGTGDSLIPHAESVRLHALAGRGAELWLVEGAEHVQSVDHPAYRGRLQRIFGSPPAADTGKKLTLPGQPASMRGRTP